MQDSQEMIDQVLADYLEAVELGAAPAPTELLAMYPELAPELAEFITVVEDVDRFIADCRSPSQRPNERAISRLFGDYSIITELGRGGMGIVYEAHQKSLKRRVALKLIREGSIDSEQDRRRLRAEAEAAAHLDHPNIVPIYEIGEYAGRPFFSMKLIEGGSLAGSLQTFSSDPKRVAKLVRTIAEAVHHAHRRGILHRDLKPSNILLDAEGEPHVADFGLAKWFDLDQSQTQTGAIIGTPAYMSPEQATVAPAAVRGATTTVSTDVYGLGAILYSLLTGGPLFAAPSLLGTLLAIREANPQVPSKINPLVDLDLDTICLKALEKDPSCRYPSALALAEDLERWLADKPIQARPITPWEKTRRWCRRNPILASMTAATSAMLLLGLMTLIGAYALVSRAYETSERYRTKAERQASQLAERLYAHQMGTGFKQVERGELDEARKLLDEYGPDDPIKGFEWHWLSAHARSRPRERIRYDGHQFNIFGSAVTADGKSVVTSGADRTIQVWDPTNGKKRLVLSASPPAANDKVSRDENCVSFSTDGRLLLSGCEDGSVRLWNLGNQAYETLQTAPAAEVLSVDISHDDR